MKVVEENRAAGKSVERQKLLQQRSDNISNTSVNVGGGAIPSNISQNNNAFSDISSMHDEHKFGSSRPKELVNASNR
jgi:hypothetical protein